MRHPAYGVRIATSVLPVVIQCVDAVMSASEAEWVPSSMSAWE